MYIIENWTQRMDHLRRSRDQHLKEIIFKKLMPINVFSNDNKHFSLVLNFEMDHPLLGYGKDKIISNYLSH